MYKIVTVGCVIAATLYMTRCYFVGINCKCKRIFSNGEIIIITGATSGIGKATAIELAKRGAQVVLACRDIDKAKIERHNIIKKTGNINIYILHLDLASFASIRTFAWRVNDLLRGQPVTAIVNNAGVFHLPETLTEDGFDLTFQVNYLGPFLLTIQLLPLLRRAPSAKIINLVSAAHTAPTSINISKLTEHIGDKYDRFKAYQLSKLCLVIFTYKLSSLLSNSTISVHAVDPGNTETNIYRNFPQLSNTLAYYIQKPIRLIVVKTPFEGSQGVLHALLCPDLKTVYVKNVRESQAASFVTIPSLADSLWVHTRAWVKITQ